MLVYVAAFIIIPVAEASYLAATLLTMYAYIILEIKKESDLQNSRISMYTYT